MRRPLLLILAISINSIIFGNNNSLTFEFNSNTFTISKGTKIQLGEGSRIDGSFRSIEKDEVITYKENFNTGKRSTNTTSSLRTGDKLYLGGHFSNKNVTVKKVKYFKKLDEYEILLFTSDGIFTLHIEDGINTGEIKAISGVAITRIINNSVNNENLALTSSQSLKDSSTSNSLPYVLYLKNGSEIKCNLLEMKLNDNLKIHTSDGSIFVFKFEDVEELKKVAVDFKENTTIEPSQNSNILENNVNTNSFQISNTKLDKTKKQVGAFYNSTFLSGYIANGDEYTADLGGGSFSNISGYLLVDHIFFRWWLRFLQFLF